MQLTPSKINKFLLFKLPSAYLCGVRVKTITATSCTVCVKHRWINQNPFKSMFWAVQGMAGELATGALVMNKIKASGKPVSMLVTANKATFFKKATGVITFSCEQGERLQTAIKQALETSDGQKVILEAFGTDEAGNRVSAFSFEWSLKVKTKK